jgi:hypothetical protein
VLVAFRHNGVARSAGNGGEIEGNNSLRTGSRRKVSCVWGGSLASANWKPGKGQKVSG